MPQTAVSLQFQVFANPFPFALSLCYSRPFGFGLGHASDGRVYYIILCIKMYWSLCNLGGADAFLTDVTGELFDLIVRNKSLNEAEASCKVAESARAGTGFRSSG